MPHARSWPCSLGGGDIYTEGTAAQEAEQQVMMRHASMAFGGPSEPRNDTSAYCPYCLSYVQLES